ncbi:hypothetical protein [Methyloglobulus sp.]|uniref:hypothetical protein n=1 Tax=Methyloglobulus sp. TaxID=2518622 RepID=UPI003989C0CD
MPEYFTKKEAVKFIVLRVGKPEDKTPRNWDKLIRTRLERAFPKRNNGMFSQDDILAHARKWYGLEPFEDFPLLHSVIAISSVSVLGAFRSTAWGHVIPGNLEECQAKIIKQAEENGRLRDCIRQKDDVIRQQNGLIKEWRPIVEEAREKKRKRKEDGKKHGGIRY